MEEWNLDGISDTPAESDDAPPVTNAEELIMRLDTWGITNV